MVTETRYTLQEFAHLLVRKSGYSAPLIAKNLRLSKATFYNWLNGKTNRIDIDFFMDNIGFIDEILGINIIKVTNTDIYVREVIEENYPITNSPEYIPIDQAERNHVNPEKGYKIVATVPAGIAEVQEHDWYETAPLEYDPDTHCFIKVDEEFGFSMMPTIAPGDLILISFTQKVQNGDLVAARWDDTKGALKIYTDNPDIPDMAVLTSYNQAIPPIFVNKNKVRLYKVVLIKKKR